MRTCDDENYFLVQFTKWHFHKTWISEKFSRYTMHASRKHSTKHTSINALTFTLNNLRTFSNKCQKNPDGWTDLEHKSLTSFPKYKLPNNRKLFFLDTKDLNTHYTLTADFASFSKNIGKLYYLHSRKRSHTFCAVALEAYRNFQTNEKLYIATDLEYTHFALLH